MYSCKRIFLLQPLEGCNKNFITLNALIHLAFSIFICEVQVSFWSKFKPRSLAEVRVVISKFCKNRGWQMDGVGFLDLKMTRYVLREEKREPFCEDHEVMEESVSWRSL